MKNYYSIIRLCKVQLNTFSKCSVPPPPQNPTMYGSFNASISKKDLEKFMNPLGFLNEEEQIKATAPVDSKKQVDEKGMPLEVGFKVEGLEPTRYGDWERKGRVSDF